MGLLDTEISSEQAEIKKLENAIAQMKMGIQRTGMMMGGGPTGVGDDYFTPPQGDELAKMKALQAQMQQGLQQSQGQLAGMQQPPQQPPQGGQQNPEAQQISQLQNEIQMLKGTDPDGAGGIYGLLGFDAGGGSGQQNFQPTMPPDQMQEIFGLLAAGSDDPTKVGLDYVRAMQNNDSLKSSARESRFRVTDAMRPRPIGGGFPDQDGNQIIPVFDPNMNNNRGGFIKHKVGKRLPKTITIGGIDYNKNPLIDDLSDDNYWVPAVDPKRAGKHTGDFEEEKRVGSERGEQRASGMVLTAEMQKVDGLLAQLIEDPDFEGGVGWLDQYTGSVGAQFGSKEGLVGKRAEYISNALTRSSVADWKGAISNAELNFFKDSVPQKGDGPEVWRTWYKMIYLPTLEFAEKKAAGTIGDGVALSTYLEKQHSIYSDAEQAEIDRAMGK